MPSREICEFCDRVRNFINTKKMIGLPNHGAIEVHIKEFAPEPLYLAVQNGKLVVEPYDYRDKDATVTLDLKTFYDIHNREISVEEALQTQRVIVDGDGEYLYCLQRNI